MARRPPVVDVLDTRALERREVVRGYVRAARVREVGDRWVDLTTEDVASRRFTRWAGADAEARAGLPADGETTAGCVRIDVVGDGVFRVRYAPGSAVPDNDTPMVVGAPAPALRCTVTHDEGSVTVTTGEAILSVGLQPLTLSWRRLDDGEEVCAAGGREKNFWNLWDAYNTGICRTVAGRPLAVETFALRPGEAVYGFGETFIRLDKVGQTIDVNMVEATGTTTPRSYKNVPFWVSSHGYGVFCHTSARLTAWVGSRAAADLQIAVEDDFLDYFVILGDIRTVLSRYTDLTGKGTVPPPWSFGYWQSKISYASAAETLDVVRRLPAAEVPVDVLHVDTHWFREDWVCDLEFDPDRFPDPAAWLDELAALGVKVSLWQLPYIPSGSALFDELAEVGGFVRDADGGIYDVAISFATTGGSIAADAGRVVGCIDFTNRAGVAVYQRHLRRLFALGARVIKADFGEQAPLDGVYHDGTPGHRAHNLYPLLYNRAVAEVTEEATGERIIWARSAWAGSQRYPLHWGGDSSANPHNLIPQIEGGLSLGLSGFQFWSQDIGGFLGQPGGELMIRWMQASMFLSHTRVHGMGTREIDAYDPEVLRIVRDAIRLRYRLLPYLWGVAADAVARSLPMARPLVVEYQDDPSTWRIGDQWLLGDALLVAPVVGGDGARRSLYLPAGEWTDWWTGERRTGGRWYTVAVPIERIPVFLREGALVPLGPALSHVGERPVDELTVRLAPFAGAGESTFVVPLPDGPVPLRYVADGNGHRLHAAADGIRVAVDRVGPGPAIDVVRSR